MAWDTTILTPLRTTKLTAKNGLVPTAVTGVARKIEVCDFYFDMRDVQWKGQTINVEYELFQMLIKQWMTDNNWTKEQALDEFFQMC